MKNCHGGDWASYQRAYSTLPIDFSANINPLGLPEEVRRAAAEALDMADRYPDPQSWELREALSARFGVPKETIVCGNGAADLIYRLILMRKPKHALIPVPVFTEYEKALSLSGCRIEQFRCRETNGFLLPDAFLDAVTEKTDLVLLCNPNNPTGRFIPAGLLERILQKCEETGTLLVVDECFLPFSERGEELTMIRHLADAPHLAVLRAFTKLYAMPGLRLGMMLCGSRSLADHLREFGQPWSVSSPAQAAGTAALQVPGWVEKTQKLIREERAFLLRGLSGLGLKVIPGEANFLLFFCGKENLSAKLREKGILIRDCSDFSGLSSGWFRVAVRTRTENQLLLQKLKEVLYVG